jgi:SNF family Na+-dependent transporter
MDTITSLIAGITVFSVLGYLSEITGKEVPDIVGSGGTGIAFISYPTAIAEFPVPQVVILVLVQFKFSIYISLDTYTYLQMNGKYSICCRY